MQDKTKGYIYILLTTVIFSTMEVALKMVAGVFAPMQITVLRFFIGGICILPFAAWTLRRRGMRLERRDFWYMAFTGLLCVPTSMVLYQLAVGSTLASVVAVVFSGNPIFVVPLAWLLFHEVIHKNNLLALLFIVAGILAIADPLHNQLSPVGVLLAVLAAVLFSFYLLLSRRITRKYGGMVTTCGSFLFGSLELFLILLMGWTGPGADFFAGVGWGWTSSAVCPFWRGSIPPPFPTSCISAWSIRPWGLSATRWPCSIQTPKPWVWSFSSSPPWLPCWPGWPWGRRWSPTCCWASAFSWRAAW